VGGLLTALALVAVAFGPDLGAAQETPATQETPAAGGAGEQEAAAAVSASGLDEAALDALSAEVAAELRCPVCRNQSVVESSAELSREMHATIRSKLAAGESPARFWAGNNAITVPSAAPAAADAATASRR